MKHRNIKIITMLCVLSIVIVLFSFGCASKNTMYKLDYCGQQLEYSNAEDTYEGGSTVTLYYENLATDTDYTFLLDGKSIKYNYHDTKGIEITFTMPEHDATFECVMVNTMLSDNW